MHVQDIPKILPTVLNCVRMIWSLSRFYNTPERLVGLLRRISNEIIRQCCTGISLPDVFSGEVADVMTSLQQVPCLLCKSLHSLLDSVGACDCNT